MPFEPRALVAYGSRSPGLESQPPLGAINRGPTGRKNIAQG